MTPADAAPGHALEITRPERRLAARLRSLAESPELLAIRTALPYSFIGLGAGLAAFMLLQPAGTPLQRFALSFAAAFGVMSVVLVVLLTLEAARRRGVPGWVALPPAVAAFALSLPYGRAASAFALARALGSSGLFLAIGVALLTVAALAVARRAFGPVTGSVLGSILIAGAAALCMARGISLTGALDALIAPLGELGDSLTALLVLTLVETLLWTIGVHGPALLAAVVLPVYINLQLQNTDALAHGTPLPHIVTVSMFLFVFPGGAGATLPLVLLLLRSKVKRVRTVAYATLLPSIFNANEPLMFGLPLVFNPILSVPFVAAPLVLAVVAWEAMNLGLVSRPAYYIPSTVPLPFGVFFATKDWRAVVLVAVQVLLGALVYAPFVAIYERSELRRKAAEA
jgi:PTS system cellobiose-specific IIC component